MRKITSDAHNAFMKRKKFKKGNTEVTVVDGLPEMYLFGNKIAKMDEDGEVSISSSGWESVTTAERLSAFVKIRLSKGIYVIEERRSWDGKWTKLNEL